jgi:hypothetical protein
MTEQDYLFKIEKVDEHTKQRFKSMFNKMYVEFRGLSFSKAELFLEHLKYTLKMDNVISGQGWEIPPTV